MSEPKLAFKFCAVGNWKCQYGSANARISWPSVWTPFWVRKHFCWTLLWTTFLVFFFIWHSLLQSSYSHKHRRQGFQYMVHLIISQLTFFCHEVDFREKDKETSRRNTIWFKWLDKDSNTYLTLCSKWFWLKLKILNFSDNIH